MTSADLDLYKGNTADLTAKVTPITAEDRTVTWSSSNTSVATVDQNGHVTAVAVGTATITATANGNTDVSADCTVVVTAVNKTLNAIIWDEEGQVFFSSFNANSLPAWTKLKDSPVTVGEEPLYLHNAFMADSSNLYASTLDISDTSVIYSVNHSNYAVTEYGINYAPAFGMARTGTSFGGGYYVYAFAKYLIFGNLEPESDAELGTFSGFPYGLLDLSSTNVGDAYAVGVCAKSVSTTSATYYFLDETGKIWQVSQNYSNSNGITFGTPSLVVDTGISAGLQYQSLYYDGTYIYWSHQFDNESELIIIRPSDGKVYHAGNFGEGVWPAAGIYVNGSAAPASVGDEDEPFVSLEGMKPLMTRDELLTEEVKERFAKEGGKSDNRPSDTTDTAEEDPDRNGGVAVSGKESGILLAAPSIKSGAVLRGAEIAVKDTSNKVEIVYTADEDDTTNGLITVAYDPDFLAFEKALGEGFFSCKADEANGVITYAFARKNDDLISNNGEIDVFIFEQINAGKTEVTITTSESGSEFNIEDQEEVIQVGEDPAYEELEGLTLSHSISLRESLAINYYIPTANLDGYENIRIHAEKNKYGANSSEFTAERYDITEYEERSLSGVPYYRFVFRNIAAKEIGDEVRVTVLAEKDGKTYQSAVDIFSPKIYAMKQLEDTSDEKLKTLLVDMLNYGSAAQAYFTYKTDEPANEDLTEEQMIFGSTELEELKSVKNETETLGAAVEFKGESILLRDELLLGFYLTIPEEQDCSNLRAEFTYTTVKGEEKKVTVAYEDFIPDTGNGISVRVGVAAKDTCQPVEARIYDTETLISNVLTYSVETYAFYQLQNSGLNAALRNVITDLMKYCKSAEAYLAK